MVKVIRDFLLHGVDDVTAFEKIRDHLPDFFRKIGDEYTIESETREKGRYYRKALIHKNSTIEMIPAIIRDHLPTEFLHIVTNITEETIYYENEHKIQWSVYGKIENTFLFSGTTRFLPLQGDMCKVMMIIHMNFNCKYITSSRIQKMLIPIIESRIPDVFVKNQSIIYQQVCREY